MNPHIAPISWFRERADAERVRALLRLSGIDSTIRADNDPPPGWGSTTAEGGVNLWMDRDLLDKAQEIMRKDRDGSAQRMCEICGRNSATVHVTEFRDGIQSARHFCQACAPGV